MCFFTKTEGWMSLAAVLPPRGPAEAALSIWIDLISTYFFAASSSPYIPLLCFSLSISPPSLSFSFLIWLFTPKFNPFAQFRIVDRLLFLKVFASLISYYFKSRNNELFQLCKNRIFRILYFLPFTLSTQLILDGAHLFCLISCLTWHVIANTC